MNKLEVHIPKMSIKHKSTLSEEENKIIRLIISSTNSIDEEIEFLIVTLENILKIPRENIITVCKNLSRKILDIYSDEKNKSYIMPIFSYITYDDSKIIFKLNTILNEFYDYLKEIYEKASNYKFPSLKGKYSLQLYEIIEGLEYGKSYYISITNLRNLFKIGDNYKLYADFKRKVILYTQKEINEKTDLDFTFKEVKEDKKVIGLNIIVNKK